MNPRILALLLPISLAACFSPKDDAEEEEEEGGTSGISGTSGGDGADGADGTGDTDGADGTDGGSADGTGSNTLSFATADITCDEVWDIAAYDTGWCAGCSFSFTADLLSTSASTCGFGDSTADLGVAPAGAYTYEDGSTTPPLMLQLYNGGLYIYGDLGTYGGGSADWTASFETENYGGGTISRSGNVSY